jgi:hypothetical protein
VHRWGRAVRSHLLMMRGHLLLMLCVRHLLLMMHLLLIHGVLIHGVLIHGVLIHGVLIHTMLVHRILTVNCISMPSHLVGLRVVCANILIVAMNILSFMRVPLVFRRVFVAVLLAIHCCSRRMLFTGHVSSFSRSGCPCCSNAFCAFALPVALVK